MYSMHNNTCILVMFDCVFRPRSDRAKLKIYNPTRDDTHNYTLRAYSANMNTTATVQLHVTGL